ncbi:MAG: hypothetical protein V4773_07320 [Verrucomicrobiota bacterium]
MPLEVLGWIYLWLGGVSIWGYWLYRLAKEDPNEKQAKTEAGTVWQIFDGAASLLHLVIVVALFLRFCFPVLYAWPLVFIVPWWRRQRKKGRAPDVS